MTRLPARSAETSVAIRRPRRRALSCPIGNCRGGPRVVFALVRTSVRSIISEVAAEFGRTMAETCGCVLGQPPAAGKAVDDSIHRGRCGISDLERVANEVEPRPL